MTDTITLPRSVVEQALEALFMYKPMVTGVTFQHGLDAMQELRAALEQPVTQEPFTVLVRKRSWLANQWEAAPCGFPDYGKQWADERINVYIHPQNLNCKSNQARLATLWGYVKEQPPRRPLTDQQINDHRLALAYDSEDLPDPWDFKQGVRAAERAHGIGGEK